MEETRLLEKVSVVNEVRLKSSGGKEVIRLWSSINLHKCFNEASSSGKWMILLSLRSRS